MKYKNLFFSLVCLLSFTAHAGFEEEAFQFCKSKGGVSSLGAPFAKDGKTCRNVLCKKSTDGKEVNSNDVNLQSANIPYGYAGAILTSCQDDSVFLDGIASGAQSGAQAGSNNGDNGLVGNPGNGQSGQQGGNSNPPVTGGGRVGGGGFYSTDLGDYMYDDHPCYKKCNRTWGFFGIGAQEGVERKECRQCLGIRSSQDGIYVGGGLGVGGTRGGGNNNNNSNSNNNNGSGNNNNGNGNGNNNSGNSGLIINGDGNYVIVVDGGHEYRVPAHCRGNDGRCLPSCRGYLTDANRVGGGGRCEYSSDGRGCIGDDSYASIQARYQTGADCVNCRASGRGEQHWLSGVAEIVGAIAPPLAQFGIAYVQSDAYRDANRYWATAAETGFEQCRLSQQDYMYYLQTNELPGMTPEQKAALGCNGFSLGGYAGMGGQFGNGYGGFGNPYIGGGYSPGFLGGMMGPYGGYNPYGGGMVGGVVGGGMVGGIPGGMVGGIYAVGGMQGGLAAGYPGGMAGGYASGYVGGMVGGAINGGGYVGGYPGGMVGGAINGGGYVGGYPGGMVGGAINGGGYPGGMVGGVVGYAVGGGVAGIPGGGINGGLGGQCGFMGCGGGGWGSGTVPWGGQGGYWGATGGWGAQQSYMQNQQASAIGANFQQQGLAQQFGMASNNMNSYGGYGGGYGAAAYSPMNLGASLNLGVGFGMF